jgi:hypothetical protein
MVQIESLLAPKSGGGERRREGGMGGRVIIDMGEGGSHVLEAIPTMTGSIIKYLL